MLRRQGGMTLQEIVMGVVLLGGITGYFIPQLMGAFEGAQWRAEAENTALRLYAALEDAREKTGMLQPMSGPALAIIPRTLVGNDMEFFGTTSIMDVLDPLGNRFGAGLPADAPIDYISDANDPENQCMTDIGNYTMQLKSDVYVANISRGWPKSYMGECVNIVCVFNAKQNKRIYLALFRKSNRIVTAESYSPTFDSVQNAAECDALDNTVPNLVVDPPRPPTPPRQSPTRRAGRSCSQPGPECKDPGDPNFGLKVDCLNVTAE